MDTDPIRRSGIVGIGTAALLVLAACSGGDVDRAAHDAVLAGNDGLRSDLAGGRGELADTQAELAAARARLREAEDLYLLAQQNARTARQGYEKAERDFGNGLLGRTGLENARAEAERAQAAAEAARTAAEAARDTARAGRDRLRTLAALMVSTRDLPKSHSGVAAQEVTVGPGKSMTIGNVSFLCDADSPEPGCVVGVTADGKFESNTVFVTASLVTALRTERLLSGTVETNPTTVDDVAVVHFPRTQIAGGDANNVSVYIRESGASADYKMTATSLGDPFGSVAAADRTANQWRLHAGTPDDRPEGYERFTGPPDFKVEAAPGTATGWSIASLDGLPGVRTVTDFGGSNLPEGERWTKAWTVEGADLGGGRGISLDVHTNTKPTATTRKVNDVFPDAADRGAVTRALSNAGFQLVYRQAANTNTAAALAGTARLLGQPSDVIPWHWARQLEIDAEDDVPASTNVDESERVRLTDLPWGGLGPISWYRAEALDTTPTGTPAWFYGIPGSLVCNNLGGLHGNSRVCGAAAPGGGGIWRTTSGGGRIYVQRSKGLTFKAAAGSHEFYVPDADWVSIGVWSVGPESGGTAADVQMGAFVRGSMPWNYADADIDYTDAPKAEYQGDAYGRYAQRDGDNQVGSGKFTATVNLAFALGASAEAGRLSGDITGFRLDGAEDPENWRLRLPATHSFRLFHDAAGSPPSCGANLVLGAGGTGCGNLGGLEGLADGFLLEGKMNARAFGPSATADANQTPGAIAGTFFAEQSQTEGRSNDLSLIGAFLAGRMPAAAE